MIIWGYDTKEVGSKTILAECPTCQNSTLHLIDYIRVFCLYYIPTLPYKRFSIVYCEGCGSSYETEFFKNHPKVKSHKGRIPWWSFSGSLILGCFVSFVFYSSHTSGKNVKSFKENPVAGKALIIRAPDDMKEYVDLPYTYVRVEHVNNETITLRPGIYSFSKDDMGKKYAASKDEKHWSTEIYTISKEDLKKYTIRRIIE